MTENAKYPGRELGETLSPRQLEQIGRVLDERLTAIAYIRRETGCSLRQAMDAHRFLLSCRTR